MLEIACFNGPSAILAAQNGADRIELCLDYAAGGTTPTLNLLHAVRQETGGSIPTRIMIRPRGGDFNYSASEFEAMKESVVMFKASASGFVFGILNPDGEVDKARCKELVQLAEKPCTFHRAIDTTPDLNSAFEEVIRCGFHSVLTSGGAGSAEAGVQRVKKLQERFGARVEIVLGGGVRRGNVTWLMGETGVRWVHSAGIVGLGEQVNVEEVRELKRISEGWEER